MGPFGGGTAAMNAASAEEDDDGVTTGAAGGGGGMLVASPRHAAHSTTRTYVGQLELDSVVATRDDFGCVSREMILLMALPDYFGLETRRIRRARKLAIVGLQNPNRKAV